MKNSTQQQKRNPITWILIIIGILTIFGVIALQSFIKSRNTGAQQACIRNLRMIETGLEANQSTRPYRKSSKFE